MGHLAYDPYGPVGPGAHAEGQGNSEGWVCLRASVLKLARQGGVCGGRRRGRCIHHPFVFEHPVLFCCGASF